MHLVMLDIDGTLVQSYDYDSECYVKAVKDVLNITIDDNWLNYTHITDSGILDEIISHNNLFAQHSKIHRQVKEKFIHYIKLYLKQNETKQVAGANAFIQNLKRRKDVILAIATGGWEETAKLKLDSAGINYSGIVFASASDHFDRINIMKIAESRCKTANFTSKNYFGDGEWDKEASKILNYNFILIGNRFKHTKQLYNFNSTSQALTFILEE